MSKVIRILKYLKARIARVGFTEAMYSLAGFITYPRGGFPKHGVDNFMHSVSKIVKQGALVLDAGAGACPYKSLFDHVRYQSCEYQSTFQEVQEDVSIRHTFYCDLETIPVEDNTYDVVVCNQVLEHVKRPHKVILEFSRVLKPDGQLFISVPQCYGTHMIPYNYFNFISYGLTFLLEEARFRNISIKPLGGIFSLLGTVMLRGYDTLLSRMHRSLRPWVLPFHIVFRLAFVPICVVLHLLDRLDNKRLWTLNYGCSCVK
jgi:SAM-dependent methyltransferase